MDTTQPIDQFEGEFEFLSNFFKLLVPIVWGDISFDTVENAYQASKSNNHMIRVAFSKMKPGKAKRQGAKILTSGVSVNRWWNDDFKLRLMERLVRLKFTTNPELAEKLLATGDREIIEGNNWHDNFFGVCRCNNCPEEKRVPAELQNQLGKILMKIRAELRAQQN